MEQNVIEQREVAWREGDDVQAEPKQPVQPPVMARVVAELSAQLATPLASGLYVVATPIGNMSDITLRGLAVLARADLILCEDTRHSGKLMARYQLAAPLEAYHEHNGHLVRPRVLDMLAAGSRVGLISDAGTPLVSDPGFKLVRATVAAGHRVEALPGPSAALAALTVAGLPTDAFLFAGFLPPKSAARRTRLIELGAVPATLIFFEAPGRVADALADVAAVLGPRPVAVARELTKLHETVLRGEPADLAATLAASGVKGECVLLVGPPAARDTDDDALVVALESALATRSVSRAAREVADALGIPRSRVYALALTLRPGLQAREIAE
jgi:16S rRNA (cytidine1402-2'-O)-methyltransferase